jgi:hypothetical protein
MIEIFVRLLLAGALGGAALAKLASPASSQAALATFGFGEGPARRFAWVALIAAELALAAGVAAGLDAASYLAAALMAMFAALVLGALIQGRAGAPCACFGSRSKVGWPSLARNLVLAAGFAVLPSLPSSELSTDQWLGLGLGLALLACAGLGVAVFALAREVGLLRLQLGPQSALEIPDEGPPVGERSDLAGRFAFGRDAELGLAVFTSPGCHICQALEPSIEVLASDPLLELEVFEEGRDAGVWRSLDIPGSPFAIAVSPEGTVLAKGTFNSLGQLESVVATAFRRRGEAAVIQGA